jgi:hypothetical protein
MKATLCDRDRTPIIAADKLLAAGHEMELDYIGGILRKWSAEA